MIDKNMEDFTSTKHKGLKEYIKESILDDEEEVFNDVRIKLEIEKFIEDNYKCKRFTISNKPNKDGKFIVDGTDILVTNKNITSLTNNLFIWGKVTGNFHCTFCKSLTSLEGAPEKVAGSFGCNNCNSLTSLKGAPGKVGGYFSCSQCNSLKSLKGAPEEVGGDFNCSECKYLKSLEGAPKEVGGDFECGNCKSLTSLDHLPKYIHGNLYILNIDLTQKHIESLTQVSGNIY